MLCRKLCDAIVSVSPGWDGHSMAYSPYLWSWWMMRLKNMRCNDWSMKSTYVGPLEETHIPMDPSGGHTSGPGERVGKRMEWTVPGVSGQVCALDAKKHWGVRQVYWISYQELSALWLFVIFGVDTSLGKSGIRKKVCNISKQLVVLFIDKVY